jgi:hypothetical protein
MVLSGSHSHHIGPTSHIALTELIVAHGHHGAVGLQANGVVLTSGHTALNGPLHSHDLLTGELHAAQVTELCNISQNFPAAGADLIYFGAAHIAEAGSGSKLHPAGVANSHIGSSQKVVFMALIISYPARENKTRPSLLLFPPKEV